MRNKILAALFGCAASIHSYAEAQSTSLASPQKQGWMISTSIATRYFLTNLANAGAINFLFKTDLNPILISPLGTRFCLVSRRGELATDRNVYELLVFDAEQISESLSKAALPIKYVPKPLAQVQLVASSLKHNASKEFGNLRWESDEQLTFVAELDGTIGRQLWSFDIPTQRLRLLTDQSGGLPRGIGDSARNGGSMVYRAATGEKPYRPLDSYPMSEVRGNVLQQFMGLTEGTDNGLFASWHGSKAKRLVELGTAEVYDCWVSPDGNWAVIISDLGDDPRPISWYAYDKMLPRLLSPRFILLNLQNGERHEVVNAPWGLVVSEGRGLRYNVFWSADSVHYIVVNTALPLDEAAPERKYAAYIVDYNVKSHEWRILDRVQSADKQRITAISWLRSGEALLVEKTSMGKEANQRVVWSYAGGKWSVSPASDKDQTPTTIKPSLPPGLKIVLRQSSNEPQMIYATNGSHEVALLDQDPVTSKVNIREMKEVRWTEPTGGEVKGGLILPDNAKPGALLPIIVQPYHYLPNHFRPDGPSLNAEAAQVFAARGYAVLYFDIPIVESEKGTPDEGPAFVARLDAALSELARDGLVDLSRVGLIGHSRGGYMAYYAITHPGKVRLAAAIDTDGTTESYGEYVTDAVISWPFNFTPKLYEDQYGTGDFWKNKSGWMDAPGFNVDRVTTPMLFTCHGKLSRIYWLETIGAFRILGKPFEFLFFPDGHHTLLRPREREALMQASVDWMDFWLRDRENDPATKGDRYYRWRAMRTAARHSENKPSP